MAPEVRPSGAPTGATSPTSSAELADRVRRTRAAMAEQGLTALMLASPENVYYLTGLNHQGYFAFTLLVLPTDGDPLLVARAMERVTIAAQVPGCVHVPYADDEPPADAAVQAVRAVSATGDRVGLERSSMYLPLDVWDAMRTGLVDVEVVDASALVGDLRAVKSPTEVAAVRRAARASSRAMEAGIAAATTGRDERDVAAAVYHEMIQAGSEHPGFAPLIRTRDRLLQEHVTWGERALGHGDALFLELSASVARYHAPLTRMVYLGRPPAGTEQAAETSLAALEAVRAALRPGAVAGDVYDAWQRVIDAGLGHGDYRRHHCGYLVGIGFPPSWVGGSVVVGLRRGSELVLREGMVFHVLSWILGQQPADYVVSDTVLVTAGGGEVLTTTPRGPAASA